MKKDYSKISKTAVIGANGFIGKCMHSAYRKYFPDTIGTSNHSELNGLKYFNLLEPEISALKLAQTGHRAALIAAAVTKIDRCEKEKTLTRKINVDGTISLIRQLNKTGIMPIFLSSDYVFDGTKENGYSDEDTLSPCTEYGREKAEVEEELKKSNSPYLIIRLCKTFDLIKGTNTLLNEMAASLFKKKEIRAASDQIFSPTWVKDVVNAVLKTQRLGLLGAVNVCSPELWSRYDLAISIAKTLGLSENLIKKVSLDDIFNNPKRPKRIRLLCNRLKNEADINFTPIHDCIEKLKGLY